MSQTGFEAIEEANKWKMGYLLHIENGTCYPEGFSGNLKEKRVGLEDILKNSQTRRNTNTYIGLTTLKKTKPSERE